MVISAEKSETMEFLGQDPVRYKVVVYKKKKKKQRILNTLVVKLPMKMGKKYSNKN